MTETLGNILVSNKFSRDDEQILALNYENLCDAEYLNRLFLPDNPTDLLEINQTQQHKWMLSEDIPEDVILFGNADDLGKEFLFARSLNEAPLEVNSNEPLTALVLRQVKVFEHIARLMVSRCSTAKIYIPAKVINPFFDSTSVKICNHHFASQSLSCVLKVLEKSSQHNLKTSTIEPILSLVIKNFQQLKTIFSEGNQNQQCTLISRENSKLLKSILCNGIINGMASIDICESDRMKELHEAFNLALTCSYGLLAIGLYTKDTGNIILAITYLLAINVRIDEKQYDFQSNSHEQPKSNHNHQLNNNVNNNNGVDYFMNEKLRMKAKLVENKLNNNNNNNNNGNNLASKYSSHASLNSLDEGQVRDLQTNDGKLASIKNWDKPHNKPEKDSKSKLQLNRSRPVFENEDPTASNTNLTVSRRVSRPSISLDSTSSVKSLGIPISYSAKPPGSENQHHRKSKLIKENLIRIPKSVLKIFRLSNKSEKLLSTSIAKVSSKCPSEVWSCGQNSYGELGHSDVNQRRSFSKINFMDGKNIVSIGAGNEHTVFVTREGKMYVSGYNDNGQCGVGTTHQVRSPTLVQSLEGEDVAQVHVYNGCEHTLAVTKDGELYSFGYNYRGQLGLGNTNSEPSPRPVKSLLTRKVVLAGCSYHHSIVLTTEGTLYSFGRNDFGQLGLGDNVDRKTPHLISNSPKDICKLSCGQFHSLLVTKSGRVYSCGKNDYGQLGLEGLETIKTFTKIPGLPESEVIVQVCCGYYHTLLLSQNGVVYCFGRNDYGQLGMGHTQPRIYGCHVIASLRDKNVISIAAGCYHSVITTSNGMLYVFGRNNHGQLGTGDSEERHAPHPVDDFIGRKIIAVAAGFYHTVVLSTDSHGAYDDIADTTADALLLENNEKVSSAATPLRPIPIPSEDKYSANNNNDLKFESPQRPSATSGLSAPMSPDKSTKRLESRELSGNFTIENKSNVTIRELISPLVEQLLQLELSNSSTASSTDSLSSPSHEVSLDWMTKHIRALAMLLELCRRHVTMSQGIELPFTVEETLKLLRSLIATAATFLHSRRYFLQAKMPFSDSDSDHSDLFVDDEYKDDETPIHFPVKSPSIVLLASDIIKEIHQYPTKKSAKTINGNSNNDISAINESVNHNDEKESTAALKSSLVWLRKEIMHAYFHLTSSFDPAGLVISEASNCLYRSFEYLFPTPRSRYHFFLLLSDNLLKNLIDEPPQNIGTLSALDECSLDYESSLRLFSKIFFKFRRMAEVMELFKTSNIYGLLIFDKLLLVYSHLSMLCLQNKIRQRDPIQNPHIYHAVAALEHCSANFVKCAIPIILFPSPSSSDSSDKDKENEASIQVIGKRIIHQIFESAVLVLDLVTSSQPITDEVTTVLRSGTVLPSVLPTVLLYAISHAQPNELFLELLPVVRALTRKLQLLGHAESAKLSSKSSLTTTNGSTTALPTKKGMKEDFQNEQSSEIMTASPSSAALASTTTAPASASASVSASSGTKKDNVVQITWWSRLLKFSVILSARITSSLISSCSLKGNQSLSTSSLSSLQAVVLHHKFWKYSFGPTQIDSFHSFDKTIRANKSISDRVRLCCKTLRDRENVFNHTYRVLWQAAKQSNTQTDVEEIEAMILDSVIAIDGDLSLLSCRLNSEEACRYRLRPIWSAITNITKSIHSKRSLLVINSEMSWKSVLDLILQLVTATRVFIVNCVPRMVRAPLPPNKKCRPVLKKYITMIIICARWKACYRLNMKRQGEIVVDLVAAVLESTLFSVDVVSREKVEDSWRNLMLAFSKDSECALRSTTGISVMRDLLQEITFPSMRADIISVLVGAWRTRIQNMLAMRNTSETFLNAGYTLHMKCSSSNQKRLFNPYPVCLDGTVVKHRNGYLNQLLLSLEHFVYEFTDPAKDLFSQSGQSELLAVGLAVKFLDLKCVEDDRCVMIIGPPLFIQLQQILILLDEKLSDIHPNDERVVAKRSHTREKIKNLRRTSSTIITMIQNVSIHLAGLGADGRPGMILQLLSIHAQLLCHFQRSRLTASFNQDLDLRLKLSGSSTDIKDKKNKDNSNNNTNAAHRRRCQELITKPLQFTRGQDGFAILGEKLMNNSKGTDYTMAMWIFLTKKPTSRYSFITGKITQNDAWPVIVLRGSDCKLDIFYGRSNEFERFTTQAVIPLCGWTHVAVVVEARKLKIFINGAMDMQVNTPANNRAIMYPVVIGSCPQSMRTRVDHVRDGFEGLLANYRYYTRALSPIHVRVIFDQGQPEAYDVREKWSYQLLSSCRVLVDTLSTLSSSTQNNQFHANIIGPIVAVLRKVADMLHLIFVSDNGRLRNAVLKILERILLMDFLDDITFSSNATIASASTTNTNNSNVSTSSHSEVSVVGATFLSEYSSFRERLVLYFMRMIGCCWTPNLAISPEDYSELKPPPLGKHQLNDRLIDFFHYSPAFIGERANTYRTSASGSSSSSAVAAAATTASTTSLALDKSVTREELTNELCQLLVGLLRNLASKDRWKDSVSSVIYRSLCKFRSAVAESNRREWTSLMVIDILGAAVFLGETPPSAYVGATVEGYFCESVSRVLSVDRITNQATVLSWSNRNSSRQLLVVRTSDLVGHSPDRDTLSLRDFVAHSMLDLMDSLKPYVQLLLTDLICVNRPEHPFLRHTLLKSVRPVEVFIFYQIMRHISRSSSIMPTELRVRQGLLQTILQFCVRTLKVQSQAEDSISDRMIPSLWAKSSKHLSSMSEKVVIGEFPPPDGERFFNDYASKHLGIAGDVSHNPQCLKMLKNGLLTELLHCMANQQSDNSTLKPNQDVCIMNDTQSCCDLNDSDANSSLRLVMNLRRGIIQLSRNLLTLPLVDETTFLSLRSPWQMLLWQSVAQIRATQHPVPLGNFMISMCTKLRSTQRSEVTHALTSSLRYASLSFFQSNHSKSVGNVIEATDLFSRLVHAGFSWINFHMNDTIGDTADIEVCYQFLKLLLPSVSFVDHPTIVLNILQLCRQALHRILVLVLTPPEVNKEGPAIEITKELLELVRNSNFDVLWTKAQEQLHLEKGSASYRVSAVAQNLTQLAAGFQIIQRFAGNPRKLSKVMANNPLMTYKPNYPKVNQVKSTVVEFDLHSCLTRWEGASAGIIIEVVLGVVVDGEDELFETIYRGNCTRLTHGGLSPSCSYIVKCRAVHGAAYSRWSDPIDFATQPGPSFFFDPMKCGPDIKISLDGLAATYNGDDCWSTVLGTEALSCGVSSWELRVAASSTAYIFVGVARSNADLQTFLGGCSNGWGFIGEQALYHNREKVKVYGDAFSVNDVIGVVLDLDNGTLSFTRNGKLLGVAFEKLHGEMFPAIAFYNAGQRIDILANSCQMTCPHEPVPCSITRVNMDDICLAVDLLYSLNCKSLLPYRVLEMTADHCTSWCNGDLVRKWATSGKGVFLATQSKELKKFGFRVNERLRTPYGVATIAGSASGRIWYHMNDTPTVWFFTSQQILAGRERGGHFMRCSYENEAVVQIPKSRRDQVDDQMNLTFDALSLQDLLDPKRWSEEMDAALIRFLLKLADMKNILPWDVTIDDVYHNFRSLQHHLTRIVITNADLSHKWGIAGPKRKAVIARLGFLRIMNSLLEHYLQVMSMDSSPDALVMDRKPAEEFTPVICTLPSQNDEEHQLPIPMHPPGMFTSRAYGQTMWPIIQLSWAPDEHRRKSFGLLPTTRQRIFTETKMKLFWEILNHTSVRPAKTDDDYDYPDDLPQVRLNRFKSFRAREAAELQKVSGEDLLFSSMFCQLWKELRQHPHEKLRISYTHPMDDGQCRAFKVRFDNEGVDDYGGPYREVFQQLCEELQASDPSQTGNTVSRPSSWSLVVETSSDSLMDAADKPPARCFLPLLYPTPNWTAGECQERYKFIFSPSCNSAVRLDLYRFLGQFIGIAVRSKITLDLSFASVIWKSVVREPLNERDIASFDAPASQFVSHLASLYVRQLAAEDGPEALAEVREEAQSVLQDLNWTATRSDGVVVELVTGGSKKSVVLDELGYYLKLYVEARLGECSAAIEAFRDGILSILPESAISLLTWEEFQKVVCGVRKIDVARLKNNTEYDDDVSADDFHIAAFWEVLEEFTEEEKSSFLRFVWARPTLPPKGVEFPQKLKIQSAVGDDATLKPDQYLPKAHTCFFSLNLPRYTSKEIVADRLRYAIANCTEMDADFRLTDIEVTGWTAIPAQTNWSSMNGSD